MGMFDSFYNIPIACPKCGADMSEKEWQTKDLECTLHGYYWPTYVDRRLHYFYIYASCPGCGKGIDLRVVLHKGFTIKAETEDGRVLCEVNQLDSLSELSILLEELKVMDFNKKSFAEGLAAFIWKHHKGKREKLFKLLKDHLGMTKSEFEKYTVSSCYNPGSYGFGVIGGPQNYCHALEGKTTKQWIREVRKYNKILKDLPVGKERSDMIYAVVWCMRKGIVE